MTFDAAEARRVQTQINRAIWTCAGIAMTASAIAGITGFWQLQHDSWGLASGLMSSLTVDVALWVALTSDRLMESVGLTADGPWARAIRWGTAIMSIVLNILAAVLSPLSPAKKILLITIHAFAPMIMVGLAELRGENARKLAIAERAALAKEEAARRAAEQASKPVETSSAPLPAPTPVLERSLVTPLALRLASQPPARRATSSSTPVKDRAFRWLDKHHGPTTTAAKLAEAINGSPHTCKKLLAEWRKQRQEVAS